MDIGLARLHGPPRRRGGEGEVIALLLDRAETGLLAVDADRRVVAANKAVVAMLGVMWPDGAETVTLAQLLDRSQALDVHGRVALEDALRHASREPAKIALLDGRSLHVVVDPAPDDHLTAAFEIKAAAGLTMERTDPLTGLSDRRWFHERLDVLLKNAQDQVAVLLIDLDRFKAVNDTHGHPVGDSLLQIVGQRLRSAVRSADAVSRIGGDEFAIAMAAGLEAEVTGSRLVNLLSRPYLVKGHAVVIGASVGIAKAPAHGNDVVSLLRAADLALHQAKSEGRQTVRSYNDDMDQRSRQRHALIEDLRRAVPLQQLELHFQPQTSLTSGALTGFEALLRWRHPERGLVRPDEFIPLAEETGLIVAMGEWVLNAACREASTWPAELSIAVNVSPQQLREPDRLPRAIAAALSACGLPASRLEIEITESALVREDEALRVFRAVRNMGVRISMDDFGTGYSSLSQLRRFPFDKLKIDRSFVRDLGKGEEAAAVIRAIAALGTSLGMATIAEGVETTEQLAQVRLDGCTEMQGYLVSKPVPADAVPALIERIKLTLELSEMSDER